MSTLRTSTENPPEWQNLNENTHAQLQEILRELGLVAPPKATRDQLIRLIQRRIAPRSTPHKSSHLSRPHDDFGNQSTALNIQNDRIEPIDMDNDSDSFPAYVYSDTTASESDYQNDMIYHTPIHEYPSQTQPIPFNLDSSDRDDVPITVISQPPPNMPHLFPKSPLRSHPKTKQATNQLNMPVANTFSRPHTIVYSQHPQSQADNTRTFIIFGVILLLCSVLLLCKHLLSDLCTDVKCGIGNECVFGKCVPNELVDQAEYAYEISNLIRDRDAHCTTRECAQSWDVIVELFPHAKTDLLELYGIFIHNNEIHILNQRTSIYRKFILSANSHPALSGLFVALLIFILILLRSILMC